MQAINAGGFCAGKQYTKKDNPQIIATLFKRPGYLCLLEMLIFSNVSSAVVVSPTDDLVGALSLDMAWLLALVAGALGSGLRGTVTAQVTNLTTVVALLTLGAVAF
jgi:hypothetical protein